MPGYEDDIQLMNKDIRHTVESDFWDSQKEHNRTKSFALEKTANKSLSANVSGTRAGIAPSPMHTVNTANKSRANPNYPMQNEETSHKAAVASNYYKLNRAEEDEM